MKTGKILRKPAKIVPAFAWPSSRAESTRWTMTWSVHQYQMPRIGAPKKMPVQGKLESDAGLIMWK